MLIAKCLLFVGLDEGFDGAAPGCDVGLATQAHYQCCQHCTLPACPAPHERQKMHLNIWLVGLKDKQKQDICIYVNILLPLV